MTYPSLLIMLFTFLKTESEVLKIGTVDKNEYKDNHVKEMSRQRHGNLLRKLLNRKAIMLYLNTIPMNP